MTGPGNSRRGFLRGAVGTLAGLAASCSREDQPYPGREIRMIVHAAAGGMSDTFARYTARGLNDAFTR